VISKDNNFFWFNPDTMEPLINSDGHVLALEDYAKFVKDGPAAMLAWTLGEGWNLFLAGNSAMEPTWGDLPTLAQDPKTSKVQGKVGAAPIPGTTESYNPITKKTTTYDLNQVANVNGGSWHGVISRASKHQEATYDFLAFMANQKNEFYNITHGTTGVQPGVKYAFLPPDGTATVQDYVEQGWNAHDVTAFTNAYYEGLVSPLQESYLRIPGTAEYWHELDVRVSAVLAGQTQPKAALDDLYQAWLKITDRYGKDKQLKIYQDSIGYKK
jgi:multiple sugar transport system substrate-binding protein